MSEGRAGDGLVPEAQGPGGGPEDPRSVRRFRSDDAGPAPAGGGDAPNPAPAPPMVRTMGRRPPVEPAAVLLAVERVGADVAALARALATQPEAVAARLDVDGATASIGVRLGALGSSLDQLRLALLAALDRAAERVDAPAWLPDVQATLDRLAPSLEVPPWLPRLQAALVERDEAPGWIPGLKAALAERDEAPPWLPRLEAALGQGEAAPAWVPDLQARLSELGAHLDSPRWLRDLHAVLAALVPRLDAPPWLADLQASLGELSERLGQPPWLPGLQATLGDLQPLVAEQQRALRDAVTQLAVLELSLATAGNEPVLNAIAKLPSEDLLREVTSALERTAGEDRDLGGRLARVEEAISHLADGVRAGAAVADVLDHLGQRLQSIEEAAARVAVDAQVLVAQVAPVPDRLSAIATQVDRITPLARAGDQAGTLFDQLGRLTARLDEVVALLSPPAGAVEPGDDRDGGTDQDLDERLEAVVDVLAGVTRRQDKVTEAADAVLERMAEQEKSVSSHLDWVGERLAEVAAHLVPDEAQRGGADAVAGLSATLEALARRQEELGAAVTALAEQDRGAEWLADQLAALAHRQDELGAAIGALFDREEGTEALARQVALVVRRQEELTDALTSSFDEGRGPMAPAAVFDRMEQRERSLTGRLDRIEALLSRSRPAATRPRSPAAGVAGDLDGDAAMSLAASVEAIAAVTEKLAVLVESSSERLDRRLSRVERSLTEVRQAAPASPPPSGSPPPAASAPSAAAPSAGDATALRLAELRAQRAEVQARLQEERLLAAEHWDDDR